MLAGGDVQQLLADDIGSADLALAKCLDDPIRARRELRERSEVTW